MNKAKELLEARQSELQKLIQEKQTALENVPEGKLRISNYDGTPHYYHRTEEKKKYGAYIKEDNIELAKALAQKDYDQRVLDLLE